MEDLLRSDQDQMARPSRKWVLLVVAAVTGTLLVAVLLLAALGSPVGTQHDSDELGGDYCAYFPEDC